MAIQTAIGGVINSLAGAAVIGKEIYDHKRQAAEKADKAAAKEAKVGEKAKKLEDKALQLAQQKGLASPNKIIFDEQGEPLATEAEAATVIAKNNLASHLAAQKRTKTRIQEWRDYLATKEAEEALKNGKE